MIQAIILDVDGVIVGEKVGFNSPYPNEKIISAMKMIRQKNIPISLCTAKPYVSIAKIVEDTHLNNVHITDAGAVLTDPIDKRIIKSHFIEKEIAKDVIRTCLENNIYIEFYTLLDYFIQRNQIGPITEKHKHVLQFAPKIVDSLEKESEFNDITKIMPIALDLEDKKRVIKVLEKYDDMLSISWGLHPYADHLQFGILTNKNCSKKEGAEEIVKDLGVSFDHILGVGDSSSDWNFMQFCGYTATLKNGTDEIKKLVKQKERGKYFIGKAVDQNGILDIFTYFSLL